MAPVFEIYHIHYTVQARIFIRIKVSIPSPLGLRQDYASTSATAGRRSSSFSLHSLRRCELDLEEEDEEDEGYDQLPPPQPRLFHTGSMQRGSMSHSHTFSSFRDCRRTPAGPQFSLSGLSQLSGPSSLIADTHTAYRSGTGECFLFDKFKTEFGLLHATSFFFFF